MAYIALLMRTSIRKHLTWQKIVATSSDKSRPLLPTSLHFVSRMKSRFTYNKFLLSVYLFKFREHLKICIISGLVQSNIFNKAFEKERKRKENTNRISQIVNYKCAAEWQQGNRHQQQQSRHSKDIETCRHHS